MSFEQELNTLLEDYISDFMSKQNLPYVVKPAIPIVWFGDMEKYKDSPQKVVTVGINPSFAEFNAKRFDFVDFENIEAINELTNTLDSYFKYNPYTEWFNSFERVLSQLDTSYFENKAENTAIHIDIYSAIATDPTWSNLSDIEQKDIQRIDLFRRLLNLLNPDIIVCSVKKEAFDDIFYEFKLEKEAEDINGKKGFFIRKYRNGNKILISGRNMNGSPFGGFSNQEIRETLKYLLHNDKITTPHFDSQHSAVEQNETEEDTNTFSSQSNTIAMNEDVYKEFASSFRGNVKDFINNAVKKAMEQYLVDRNKQQNSDADYRLKALFGKKESVPYRIISAYFIARRTLGEGNIYKENLLEICNDRWDMPYNTFNTNFAWLRNGSGQCKQQVFDDERKKVYLHSNVKDFLEEHKDYFIQRQEEYAEENETEDTKLEENQYTSTQDKNIEAYIHNGGYACNDWKKAHLLAVFDILRRENKPMTVSEVRQKCFDNYHKYGISKDEVNSKIIYECLFQHADCNGNRDAAKHYKFFTRDNLKRYFFNNHTLEILKKCGEIDVYEETMPETDEEYTMNRNIDLD